MAVAAPESLASRSTSPLSGAADDHRPAGADLEQADAAQDQRAHDPLAELGLGDQQSAQIARAR